MKVSTDACIFGAYTAVPETGNILDIGTGTGLLALMIAQRSLCKIDAVEIDEQSFLQAASNILKSPWSNRIHLYHADIRKFASRNKYDLIICNPPFFEKHLKSPSAQKNKAKHADQLSLEELMTVVKKHLKNPDGKFSVLLPAKITSHLLDTASRYNLYPEKQLLIRDNPSRPVIRAITQFSLYEKLYYTIEKLETKDNSGQYSEDFLKLLRPFYLYL